MVQDAGGGGRSQEFFSLDQSASLFGSASLLTVIEPPTTSRLLFDAVRNSDCSTLVQCCWMFDNHETLVEGEWRKRDLQSFAVLDVLVKCSNGDSPTNDTQIDFFVIFIEITQITSIFSASMTPRLFSAVFGRRRRNRVVRRL